MNIVVAMSRGGYFLGRSYALEPPHYGEVVPMALYVIQVAGGKEGRVVELIDKFVSEGLVQECFIPRYEIMRRYRGEWHKRIETLVPGYLFIECKDVGRVNEELRRVPAFTRLLGNDDRFIPLTDDEVRWLNAFTDLGDRVVKMSEGVIEGDKVIVLNGPLMNHEGQISKIDRHRRIAYLDMPMMGRTKTIKVGLEIVSKRT